VLTGAADPGQYIQCQTGGSSTSPKVVWGVRPSVEFLSLHS
jgi:hypothetical protein